MKVTRRTFKGRRFQFFPGGHLPIALVITKTVLFYQLIVVIQEIIYLMWPSYHLKILGKVNLSKSQWNWGFNERIQHQRLPLLAADDKNWNVSSRCKNICAIPPFKQQRATLLLHSFALRVAGLGDHVRTCPEHPLICWSSESPLVSKQTDVTKVKNLISTCIQIN